MESLEDTAHFLPQHELLLFFAIKRRIKKKTAMPTIPNAMISLYPTVIISTYVKNMDPS
jgi:hypothetical protein